MDSPTKLAGVRLFSVAGALTASIGLGFAAPAQPTGSGAAPPPQFVELPGSMELSGRMIARPVQGGGDDVRQLAHDLAVQLLSADYRVLFREDIVDHYIFLVPAGQTEQQVAGELLATGLFEFVEPDWILYPIGCPNDPRFGSQWHHRTDKLDTCAAWDIHTGGPSVGVGICDTGVQTNHPDLLLNRLEGYNAVDRAWESNGGRISPVHPHGTQTTGCAAANGNNGTGVAGVGWNLSHRMLRVSNSSSGSANLSTLTHAAITSIQAGDRVANVSYSGVDSSSVRSTATQIKNLGGLLCWSAGNDGRYLDWGNRDNDDVIVVGATNANDQRSSFSAYGPSVDLMAPGSSVYTTSTGSGYGSVSGTSFSSPLTAGLIALMWSSNPGLSPDEVEQFLKQGCDDLGSSGVDNTYGYGRIDVNSSLLLAGGDPNTPPEITINSPTDGGTYSLGSSISFNSTTVDAEDGDISDQVTWISTLDGLLGVGDFSSSSLSEGVHFIDVEVTDSGGLEDYELLIIEVTDGGGVPSEPVSIQAHEVVRPGKVNFKWTDTSGNETGFEIERMQRVNGQWTNRETIAVVGPGTELFSNIVGPGGSWRYRVRALGDAGDSPWSGWKPSKPRRPQDDAISASNGTITFTWVDETNLELSFQVQRRQRVNGTWTAWSDVASLPAETEVFEDAPGPGRFRYRVRAVSDPLTSLWQISPIVDN